VEEEEETSKGGGVRGPSSCLFPAMEIFVKWCWRWSIVGKAMLPLLA
jgi:hypothetical protein